MGELRFPGSTCSIRVSEKMLIRKDYMLLLPYQLIAPAPQRCFLFDLGASTYNTGRGGASQDWFIMQYGNHGVHFDRVFAWEAHRNAPMRIFDKGMPNHVLDRMSYYNVPVEAAPGGRLNPMRTLKAIAKKYDFVVVKIDIDTPHIEQPLVEQIAEDPELASLIDELFYEHHVHRSPMTKIWGQASLRKTNATLPDSYDLFSRLRQLGIRAHSWV